MDTYIHIYCRSLGRWLLGCDGGVRQGFPKQSFSRDYYHQPRPQGRHASRSAYTVVCIYECMYVCIYVFVCMYADHEGMRVLSLLIYPC